MAKVRHIETVSEMMHQLGITDVRHPLIETFSMDQIKDMGRFDGIPASYGFYMVVYKKSHCGNVLYGQNELDYADGTFLFYAPMQTVNPQGLAEQNPQGRLLIFHPELLRGTMLDGVMQRYSYFGYSMNEALHVSEREQNQMFETLNQIEAELERNIDKRSHELLCSLISLLLGQASRFYDRQFITRRTLCLDVVSRFEKLIVDYFEQPSQGLRKLPTMQYFSDHLYLSPNYIGDLVKNATGHSAKDIITHHVLDEAKRRLTQTNVPVAEIAWSLGFEYPQYFANMFKKQVGITPLQYRKKMTQLP